MARSDRLLRLLQALRTLPPPITAARLAEDVGVSLRTLYRDIDGLRAAGAIIEGAAGYGYRFVEDIALPPQSFTRTEIEALVLGLAEVRQIADPELAKAAEAAFAKVTAALPERLQLQALHAVNGVYRAEPPQQPDIDMGFLRSACWEERELQISYVDADSRTSERRVWPLSVVYLERVSILLAWCRERAAFRRFRTDRITHARPTGASFRPRRVPLLRDFIAEMRADPT